MKTFAIIFSIGFLFCHGFHNDKNATTTIKTSSAFNTTDTSINGEWFLQPVVPSDTATDKVPVIIFDLAKGTFTGNNGCNKMNGKITIRKSSLSFNDKIMTTKMACQGYNEQGFMKNLLKTDRYKIEGGLLILMSGTTELSKWTRKIQPEIRAKA